MNFGNKCHKIVSRWKLTDKLLLQLFKVIMRIVNLQPTQLGVQAIHDQNVKASTKTFKRDALNAADWVKLMKTGKTCCDAVESHSRFKWNLTDYMDGWTLTINTS